MQPHTNPFALGPSLHSDPMLPWENTLSLSDSHSHNTTPFARRDVHTFQATPTYRSGTVRKVPTRSVFRDQCHCYLICTHYVYHRGGYAGIFGKTSKIEIIAGIYNGDGSTRVAHWSFAVWLTAKMRKNRISKAYANQCSCCVDMRKKVSWQVKVIGRRHPIKKPHVTQMVVGAHERADVQRGPRVRLLICLLLSFQSSRRTATPRQHAAGFHVPGGKNRHAVGGEGCGIPLTPHAVVWPRHVASLRDLEDGWPGSQGCVTWKGKWTSGQRGDWSAILFLPLCPVPIPL